MRRRELCREQDTGRDNRGCGRLAGGAGGAGGALSPTQEEDGAGRPEDAWCFVTDLASVKSFPASFITRGLALKIHHGMWHRVRFVGTLFSPGRLMNISSLRHGEQPRGAGAARPETGTVPRSRISLCR